MSENENGSRYVFSGHAVGISAHFDRLGELEGLNHIIPALGAAVLPVTGGLSHSHASGYDYPVDRPWKRSLVSVKHVESSAEGRGSADGYRTEVQSKVQGVDVVEKMHIKLVELHLSSTRKGNGPAEIRTTGNKIEGMRLGNVEVHVDIDNETLCNCGTKQQIADFYNRKGAPLQDHCGYYLCTLVRGIKLSGRPDEVEKIKVEGNKITWPGFGRIYLGEVWVGESQRRMTLVRLDMGSDAGGSGSIGDASTNGFPST